MNKHNIKCVCRAVNLWFDSNSATKTSLYIGYRSQLGFTFQHHNLYGFQLWLENCSLHFDRIILQSTFYFLQLSFLFDLHLLRPIESVNAYKMQQPGKNEQFLQKFVLYENWYLLEFCIWKKKLDLESEL